jgi:hypothetical protein
MSQWQDDVTLYCDSTQEWAPVAEGAANFAKMPA